MSTIKIMSFNMRTQTEHDGVNQFFNRRELISDSIDRLKPDVIGFQEIQPVMYKWLVETLGDYYIVGGGRGVNYDNEAVCIGFRKSNFTLYDCETFWLSPTPNQPGSRYTGDQSGCPRICTWVTLKPCDGKPFRFYNVHTDHEGQYARVLAANQVLQKIDENNSKMLMRSFVTGDFNDYPDSLCIKTMISCSKLPLVDLCADSGETFHAFGAAIGKGYKIDYIFADADTKCVETEVIKDKRGEVYISDHYPIMATVEID
ncbi:MAG: endonuclease/exonuclease/phosphatase family protein [Clostridiales bacterium]|nr:endonuclease/exonuclease/phosphatase family protein [Clostridiales bacterium]